MRIELTKLLEKYNTKRYDVKVVESMLVHLGYPLLVENSTSEWLLSQWWEVVSEAIEEASWFLSSGIEYRGTVHKAKVLLAHDGECLYNAKLEPLKEPTDENTSLI